MTRLTPIETAALKSLLIATEGEPKELEKIAKHFSDTSLEIILSATAKIAWAIRAELAAESREVNS